MKSEVAIESPKDYVDGYASWDPGSVSINRVFWRFYGNF
jgi:hypothetical protein